MTFLSSVALRSAPTEPIAEQLNGYGWRGVSESASQSPTDMAIAAGRAALAASTVAADHVRWTLHAGSGYQGPMGWPAHHEVQQGIVGSAGNAIEVKQYCAAGLTMWVLASGLLATDGGAVICTGADNWGWGDRFSAYRAVGGEPFSDVAHAAVLSPEQGFASILGHGTASCPNQAASWRTREAFWQHATLKDYQSAYRRAVDARTPEAERDSRQMLLRAVGSALTSAGISPQYVTHFIPHGSGSGEPYRSLAKAVGLPWSDELHEHQLDHGYLAVSTQAAGLIHIAQVGLPVDSIVLLLATEYLLSVTAVLVRVVRVPQVVVNGETSVVS